LIRRTAATLQGIARQNDVVARLGGDEFGVLLVQSDLSAGVAVNERLRRAFAHTGIAASIGMAQRRPATGLAVAWDEADQAMYRAKRGGA
jgi:diguanylate cyclase (GGDEF)-like protein